MRYSKGDVQVAVEILLIRGNSDSCFEKRGNREWSVLELMGFVCAPARLEALINAALLHVNTGCAADNALEAARLLTEGWRPGDPVVRL